MGMQESQRQRAPGIRFLLLQDCDGSQEAITLTDWLDHTDATTLR